MFLGLWGKIDVLLSTIKGSQEEDGMHCLRIAVQHSFILRFMLVKIEPYKVPYTIRVEDRMYYAKM